MSSNVLFGILPRCVNEKAIARQNLRRISGFQENIYQYKGLMDFAMKLSGNKKTYPSNHSKSVLYPGLVIPSQIPATGPCNSLHPATQLPRVIVPFAHDYLSRQWSQCLSLSRRLSSSHLELGTLSTYDPNDAKCTLR